MQMSAPSFSLYQLISTPFSDGWLQRREGRAWHARKTFYLLTANIFMHIVQLYRELYSPLGQYTNVYTNDSVV